jgi:flagellar biosynthesis/type III secretory pathway protein FliH
MELPSFPAQPEVPEPEKQTPPEVDWDKVNTAIREMFIKDDEEIQKKASEDSAWLEEYLEQLEITRAKKKEQEKQQTAEEEQRRLEQEEEERAKALAILEELGKKAKEEGRENDPVLRILKRMAKIIESEKSTIEERYD